MGLSIWKDTVTVLRAPLVSRNGGQTRDWNNATSHGISGVQVTAAGTSQDFAGRVLNVNDSRTFRANFDADIQEGDRIVYLGVTYEVSGEVFHTQSPTGRASSTRCALTRWTG